MKSTILPQRCEVLSKAFECSPTFMFISEFETGKLVEVNNAFCALTGYARDELIGKSSLDLKFFPEEDRIHVTALLKATGRVLNLEGNLFTREGTVKSCLYSAELIDQNGKRFIVGSGVDITDRKREAARFRALVETSSEVLYRMSSDWAQMHQLTSGGFLANTESPSRAWLDEYIHPDDQPHVKAVIAEAIRTKTVFELTHRVRKADGSLGWTHSRAVPLLDENGEITEWFGSASDVTQRKQAEEALQRRQEEFRALVENAPDVISLFDRNLRRIYVNAEIRENTGRDASFMIGQSLTEAGYPESFAQPLNAALQNVFATGREETVEIDWDAPKGHIWLQIRCAPIRTADGSIEHVMSIGRDITDRKAAEKALIQSEARLSAILNELPIGVGVFDKEGRTILKNDLMRNHIPDMLPSRDPGWRKRWHAVDSDGTPFPPDRWPGARALRGERVVPGMEFRFTDHGRTFWKMVSAVPFSNINAGETAAIAVIQDITELKQAEAALRETNQELNEYTYALTHNVKAPFRAIQNYANFLLEDLADTLKGESRQFLNGIKRAVNQAHQQFSDLEALYRIRKHEVDFEPVDMRAFLEEIASLYPIASDRQLVISDQRPFFLRTERFLLRQILLALIGNGLKYNQSAVKRVEVGCQKTAERFEIFVRDNGIGIDPQYHEHIFHIFKRLHTEKEYEGTGIGLAIVSRAAQRISGELRVESAPGQGSTFVISLPAAMVESEPEA